MIVDAILNIDSNSIFPVAWIAVTSTTSLPYNPEFYFNFTNSGGNMAMHTSFFALLGTFLTLLSKPAFSKQIGSTCDFFSPRPFAWSTFSLNDLKPLISFQDKHEVFVFADSCGSGAQGGEVTNPNGNANVSPNSKVNNPSYAVDRDLSTYSELHIDVQQKNVEVIQKITFDATYPTDIVKLTLSLGTALFNYRVTAQAYNNDSTVGTIQDITSSLTLYPTTVVYTFNPGVVFNQVRIGVIALQNGNHIASINLHEISLAAPPTPQNAGNTSGGGSGTTSTVSACEGDVILTVDNPTTGAVYNWYNSSNVKVSSSAATSYSPTDLVAGYYVYYVAAARTTTCPVESEKHTINLTVAPKPATPSIELTN